MEVLGLHRSQEAKVPGSRFPELKFYRLYSATKHYSSAHT